MVFERQIHSEMGLLEDSFQERLSEGAEGVNFGLLKVVCTTANFPQQMWCLALGV